MKKLLRALLIWVGFSFGLLFGQSVDFNDYHILTSQGELPLDLKSKLYDELEDHKTSSNSKNKKQKKDEQDFIIQSTYSLDRLLRSGMVVFNDPVGQYLTSVLQEVLKANGIEKEITVYFVRSEAVNAYATDKNFIFFTAGLLAQVTSEAQIAMILSHEYVHFQNKHSRDAFIDTRAAYRDYRTYKSSSTVVNLMLASYSRDKESEADEEGFKLFANSRYNLDGALEAFDVLRFSYLPFEEVPYEKSFLETADLVFPDKYFLPKVADIEYVVDEKEDDDDEKFRSHPYIGKRITAIQTFRDGMDNSGRSDFIVSEADFYTTRKIARYEVCRLYLINREYEKAFYSGFVMLKEEPNSIFLKKVILKSLYGLAKFSNHKKFTEVHQGYKKMQGESQQVNFFMDELSKKELNLVALHYAWRMKEEYPNDADIDYIVNDLAYEACAYHSLTPYSLATEHPDTLVSQTSPDSLTTDTAKTKTGKYDKIKVVSSDNKSSGKGKKSKTSFVDYGFVTFLKNPDFKKTIRDQYDQWEADEAAKDSVALAKRKKKKYSEDIYDDAGDISSMMVLNPVVLKIDLRKDRTAVYNSTLNKRTELLGNIDMLSQKLGISTISFQPEDLSTEDAGKLHDMTLLNTCMYEMMTLPEGINILPTDNLDLQKISADYETQYLTNVGVLTFVENKKGVALAVGLTVFSMGFYLPYLIYTLTRPNVTTLTFLSIYDLQNHKFVFSDVSEIKAGGTQDLMSSVLYDMILKLKPKKK